MIFGALSSAPSAGGHEPDQTAQGAHLVISAGDKITPVRRLLYTFRTSNTWAWKTCAGAGVLQDRKLKKIYAVTADLYTRPPAAATVDQAADRPQWHQIR